MDSIKDILPQIIEKISSKKQAEQITIQKLWADLIGKKMVEHTSIVRFQDGTLTVLVDAPARLFQLNAQRVKFLARFKEEGTGVNHISLKIGSVR